MLPVLILNYLKLSQVILICYRFLQVLVIFLKICKVIKVSKICASMELFLLLLRNLVYRKLMHEFLLFLWIFSDTYCAEIFNTTLNVYIFNTYHIIIVKQH